MPRSTRQIADTHTSSRWVLHCLGLFAVALCYFLLLGPTGLPRVFVLQDTVRQRSDDAYARIVANADLRQRLDRLRHDDQALAEEARSSGFVRPDEVILILPTDTAASPRGTNATAHVKNSR